MHQRRKPPGGLALLRTAPSLDLADAHEAVQEPPLWVEAAAGCRFVLAPQLLAGTAVTCAHGHLREVEGRVEAEEVEAREDTHVEVGLDRASGVGGDDEPIELSPAVDDRGPIHRQDPPDQVRRNRPTQLGCAPHPTSASATGPTTP